MANGDGPASASAAGPLAGKTAIITGAGQGAGRGIAEAFVRAGARVALLGRSLGKLEDVAAGLPEGMALPVACDVGDGAQITCTVAKVVEAYGGVRILVNAAQHTVRGGAFLDVPENDIDALWRTGPLATLRLMRACYPYLRGDGVIINFGSGAQFTPQGYGVYAGTKEAIQAFTRTAAVEWGPENIRCHLIVPLVVSPSMAEDRAAAGRGYDSLTKGVPLQRLGTPDDIGRAAVFLAGPDATYMTGQVLMLDGGSKYHR
ncbi:SDR family oxidoreductase [Streptomyces sp. NPDC002896]|uniref:SDR family NAD(P)-dependent oxidoreductase n=1 Tax=Streptomyces sp. NPDC002896 TaxID=3154438 RepID=UPI00331DD9E5